MCLSINPSHAHAYIRILRIVGISDKYPTSLTNFGTDSRRGVWFLSRISIIGKVKVVDGPRDWRDTDIAEASRWFAWEADRSRLYSNFCLVDMFR